MAEQRIEALHGGQGIHKLRLYAMLILVILAKLVGGVVADTSEIPAGHPAAHKTARTAAAGIPGADRHPLTPIGMLGARVARWLRRLAATGGGGEIASSVDRLRAHPPR